MNKCVIILLLSATIYSEIISTTHNCLQEMNGVCTVCYPDYYLDFASGLCISSSPISQTTKVFSCDETEGEVCPLVYLTNDQYEHIKTLDQPSPCLLFDASDLQNDPVFPQLFFRTAPYPNTFQINEGYLYTFSGSTFSILKITTNVIVSSFDVGIQIKGFQIAGSYAVVFGWNTYNRISQATQVKVINLQDISHPQIIITYTLSGRYFSSHISSSKGFFYILTSDRVEFSDFPTLSIDGNLVKTHNLTTVLSSQLDEESYTCWAPEFINILAFKTLTPSSYNSMAIITKRAYDIYMTDSAFYFYYNILTPNTRAIIHKFTVKYLSLTSSADANLEGSISQYYSFDYRNGLLRVITSSPVTQSGRNILYVLNDTNLSVKHRLEFGQGERIVDAQFTEERGYFTSQKISEPTYIIELNDLKGPAIRGKFYTISSYSRFFKVFEQDILAVFERASPQHLAVHLANVANPQNWFIISSSSFINSRISSIDFQFNTLYLSVSENLLVIPSRLNFNDLSYNGAAVFNLKSSIIDYGHSVERQQIGYHIENIQGILAYNGILYTKSQCLLIAQYGYNGNNPQFIEVPPTCTAEQVKTRK